MENPFVKLFAVNLKDHLEVKKSGSTELKYVSWPYAWAEVKKLYPSASYEVKKFNGLPYVYDPITGFMVYTSVTIEGVSHEMWLPVMDNSNKAIPIQRSHWSAMMKASCLACRSIVRCGMDPMSLPGRDFWPDATTKGI